MRKFFLLFGLFQRLFARRGSQNTPFRPEIVESVPGALTARRGHMGKLAVAVVVLMAISPYVDYERLRGDLETAGDFALAHQDDAAAFAGNVWRVLEGGAEAALTWLSNENGEVDEARDWTARQIERLASLIRAGMGAPMGGGDDMASDPTLVIPDDMTVLTAVSL